MFALITECEPFILLCVETVKINLLIFIIPNAFIEDTLRLSCIDVTIRKCNIT